LEEPFEEVGESDVAAEERLLADSRAGDDHKTLRKIAAALLAKAANGDVPSINSLANSH
jgi:hypothetical protein